MRAIVRKTGDNMPATRARHTASYNREAILKRLLAQEPTATPKKRAPRTSDGTVSFKQAITVKACADHLGDTFAWIDKPRKGRYIIAYNGVTLTPGEASTIIEAWFARPR